MFNNQRFQILKETFINKKRNKYNPGGVNNIQGYNEIELKQNFYLDIPKNLKSEFHFLKFPFFDLCPRKSKRDILEIKEVATKENEEIKILWRVSRNINFDFPSSFARRVHKEIVERIINNIKKPILRLVKLGSLRQICIMLNIAPSGGNYKEIKKALKNITTTSIEAKGTFRIKEGISKPKYIEDVFHLYDRVFFIGETLPDGTQADAVYILLNDMYVQNFNNNFVVPLDYEYFQTLQGDIASRMYEILSIWFYPALEYNKQYIDKKYSELCDYFPLTRQNEKWKAKKQLKKAHQQHTQSGFLFKEPDWLDNGKKDDWLIRYYIGQKAKSWYKQNKKDLLKENHQNQQPLLDYKSQQQGDSIFEDPLVAKLSEIGITKDVAVELVTNYDKEKISFWLKAIKDKSPDDKPAFLVKAIKEDWELPEKYRKKKQKAEKEKAQTEYNQFIKNQIDKHLKQMSEQEKEQELKHCEENFFKQNPVFETFKNRDSVKPYIEAEYLKTKKKELGLPTFEEWQNHSL